MTQINSRALILAALFMFFGPTPSIAASGGSAEGEKAADAEPEEELLITLEAPLTSPLFSETPVAMVDEEPITFADLVRRIGSIHQQLDEGSASSEVDYAELLNRLVTTRLIVHEARNIGLDELPSVAEDIDNVSTELLISKLMSRQLDRVTPEPSEVDALYEMMSREFELSTVKFKNEADALAFKEEVDKGDAFEEVAKKFAEESKAEFEPSDGKFIKLKDLLPRIAQKVIRMKSGTVSEIFADPGMFLMFHIESVRPYDDPELLKEAQQKALEPAKKKAAREYAKYLEEKYCTVDERLLKKADFESKKTGFLSLGKEEPASFDDLEKDERVVATVNTDPPYTVTIADLARALRGAFYHGVETAAGRKKNLNKEKQIVLANLLFKRTAVAEARSLGIDQTEPYRATIDEYTTSLLFDVFVQKVVAPDVKISEDEVLQYYKAHVDDYSNPKMFRMSAIVFREPKNAQDALRKLQRGADFKWVSANSPGQVASGTPAVLDFDGALLTLTGVPEDLRGRIADADRGDALIYSDDKGYHYVIEIDEAFPPTPQPYESVRGSVAQAIFEQKIKILIADWVEKLKAAYETRIFVKQVAD